MSLTKMVSILALVVLLSAVAVMIVAMLARPDPNEILVVPDGALEIQIQGSEGYTGTYEFLPPETPQLPKAHCVGIRKDKDTVLVVCEVEDPLPQ